MGWDSRWGINRRYKSVFCCKEKMTEHSVPRLVHGRDSSIRRYGKTQMNFLANLIFDWTQVGNSELGYVCSIYLGLHTLKFTRVNNLKRRKPPKRPSHKTLNEILWNLYNQHASFLTLAARVLVLNLVSKMTSKTSSHLLLPFPLSRHCSFISWNIFVCIALEKSLPKDIMKKNQNIRKKCKEES